jgi:hypothetical protein
MFRSGSYSMAMTSIVFFDFSASLRASLIFRFVLHDLSSHLLAEFRDCCCKALALMSLA